MALWLNGRASENSASRTCAGDSFRQLSSSIIRHPSHDAMPRIPTTVAYKRVCKTQLAVDQFPARGAPLFATETCAGHGFDTNLRRDHAPGAPSAEKHTFAGSNPVTLFGVSLSGRVTSGFSNLRTRRFRVSARMFAIPALIAPSIDAPDVAHLYFPVSRSLPWLTGRTPANG